MSIDLNGHQYTSEQLIAAIAASDNDQQGVTVVRTLEEVDGVLQAVLHRLAALEDRLPTTRAGFAVTETALTDKKVYRVQTLDHLGRTVITTYEIPI